MRLFVPTTGTKLCLEKDWEFSLFYEHRNADLIKSFNLYPNNILDSWRWYYDNKDRSSKVILPKGTVLIVDRIYIRKNAKEYDSLSFIIRKEKGAKIYGRFWAKLIDVNNIDCSILENPIVPIGKSLIKKTISSNKNKIVFANMFISNNLSMLKILDFDDQGNVDVIYVNSVSPRPTRVKKLHQSNIANIKCDNQYRRTELQKAIEKNLGRTDPHHPVPYVLPEI